MGKSVPKPVPKPVASGTIVIEDKTVIKLLTEQDQIVSDGREVSKEIDALQKEIDKLTEKEMKLTAKVEPQDLIKRGDELKEVINKHIAELEEVAQEIKKQKLAAIPKEIQDKHLKLNSDREKLEVKRNKLALKVQKIKDRLIPKLQKHTKGHLEEFEDLLSAELKDGKAVVEKFSHLTEWKRMWNEKNSK